MDIALAFDEFLINLEVKNSEQIINRFKQITKRLNTDFHNLNSEDDNGLYVGSFGRNTAINGVSDLDMNFILPDDLYKDYNNRTNNGQSALLQDVKNSIIKTYSTSKVRGDGQVVVVEFKNDFIEVCPVFQEIDGSFTYPDSNNGGTWKKTNPSPETEEIKNLNDLTNNNLINICKIVRAWKDKNGVKIGGLLIDTLVYNFFKSNEKYHTYESKDYDLLIKDFFEYLKDLDTKKYWYAPGSNQHVYSKNSNFKAKAKKAFKLVEEAILNNDNDDVYEDWRKIFGKCFPYPQSIMEASNNYNSDEEYIEYKYPLNIIYRLRIDCRVEQQGFPTELLRKLFNLRKNKKLTFFVDETDVPQPYTVKWKIKNEGLIAKQRNCLRGQIISSNKGSNQRRESSNFEGKHYAECYIIKDGYCVARDRIDVPISTL